MAWILGTKPAEHDSCFVLLNDSEPVFIHEQERFNRVKHGRSCDLNVLFESLAEYGVRPDQLDYVANYIDAGYAPEARARMAGFLADTRPELGRAVGERAAASLGVYRRLLLEAGFPAARIIDVRHHLCHCAGVYYPSPFAESAILSIDGGGEAETMVLAHGRDAAIDILQSNPMPHSLGHFYEEATRWLGWEFGEEGKTMALAAYGTPRHHAMLRERIVEIGADGSFKFRRPLLASEIFVELFGPKRTRAEALTAAHKDVAASVQKVCEEAMLAAARRLKELTGSRHLLITGGVALNSVANGKILKAGLFDQVQAYPQANDTGTALGAALWVHYNIAGARRRRHWVMNHAYLGRPADLDNVEAVAAGYGLAFRRVDDPAEAAAELLEQGKIVGWIQGRAEVGPRALGNRSILGSPLIPEMKDRINARIKNRELWRPFAPSVTAEAAATYFDADQPLPYMIITVDLRPEWRDRLAAVCHVDGTARVQTVDRDANPRYHALLSAFGRRTGVPMLLNTSFNDRGEPVAQTARDAIELFLRTQMDALVIGDCLFEAKPADVAVPPFHPANRTVERLGAAERVLFLALAPIADHLPFLRAAARRGVRLRVLASDPASLRAGLAGIVADGDILPLTALAESEIVAADAIVFGVDAQSSDYVFAPTELHRIVTPMTGHMLQRRAAPVFWLDFRCDLTDMRAVWRLVGSGRDARPQRADLPAAAAG